MPLIFARLPRRLIAVILVLGAGAFGVVVLWSGAWLFWPWVLVAPPVAFVAALLAGRAIAVGHWWDGAGGVAQRLATAVLAAGCVAAAALAARFFGAAMDDRVRFAAPAWDAGFWLTAASAAATALALLLAALPLRVPRIPLAAAAVLAALASCACAAAAVAVTAGHERCEELRWERDRWRAALAGEDEFGVVSEMERLGQAVVHCRLVDGADRAAVHGLLGAPHRGAARQIWFLGTTRDVIGPGDRQELIVRFGPDGRVARARLLYD